MPKSGFHRYRPGFRYEEAGQASRPGSGTSPPVVSGGAATAAAATTTGGGGQAAGFNLPPGFLDMLTQGGQYELPWDQQLLLYQQALYGASPEQIQAAADRLFTPQRWAQLKGYSFIGEPGVGGGERLRMPGGQKQIAPSPWLTKEEFLGSMAPYQKWREEQTQALIAGVGSRQSGFLPDRGAYMAELQGTLTEYAAQLGVSKEAFEANLAQRGISGAGQATEARYRDVTAPVMRAGAQATRQSFLDYLQAYQRGSMFQETIKQGSISRLTSTEMQVEQIRTGNRDLMLRAFLGEGQMQFGYEQLEQQQQQFNKQVAFRTYENKLRVWMFKEQMKQREREGKRKFWSDLLGDLFDIAGTYVGVKAGG